LKGDYELKNVGLVAFVASHSFNVSPLICHTWWRLFV